MQIKGYTTNINAGYAMCKKSLKYKQFIKTYNICINLYKKTKLV